MRRLLLADFGNAGPASRFQFIEVKRTSRLGTQVVKINAELLHFHSTPSALESSIGGVDLIGAKVAPQASVSNAIMSNDRFIAVLPGSGVCRLAAFLDPSFDRRALLSGLGFSLSSRAVKMALSDEQIVSWPRGRRNLFTRSRPQSGMRTGEIWTALRRERTGGNRHWDAPFTTDIATRRLNFKPNLTGRNGRLGSLCRQRS